MKILRTILGRTKAPVNGLKYVKQNMGVAGKEDLSKVFGERLYLRPDGNVVAMATPNDSGNYMIIKTFYAPGTDIKGIQDKIGIIDRERVRYQFVRKLIKNFLKIEGLKNANEFDIQSFSKETVSKILKLLNVEKFEDVMVATGKNVQKIEHRKYRAEEFLPSYMASDIYKPANKVKYKKK